MTNKINKPYAFVRNGASAELCFYNDIGSWGCTLEQVKSDLDLSGNLSSLSIRINSAGGDAYEGLGIFNYIRSLGVPVTVDIDGLAASAASIIAMSGNVVRMPRTAQIMIHEPWIMAVGDSEDLRGIADGLDALSSSMVAVYMTKAKATKEEIAALVKAETWLSADEALKLGLITEISGESVEVYVQDENKKSVEEVLTAENAQAFLNKRMASVSKPQASALIDRVRASANSADDSESVRENTSEEKAETSEQTETVEASVTEQVSDQKESEEVKNEDESKEEDKKEEEKKDEANVIHLEIDIDPIALVELCKLHGEPEFARTAAKAKMSLKDVQAKLSVRSEIKSMANRFRAAATYIDIDDAELLKFETVAQARTAIFAKLAESEAKIDSRPAAPLKEKTAKTELKDAVEHSMRNMYPNAYKR